MVTTANDGDRLSTQYTRGENQASLPQPHLNDVIPAIDPDAHAGCTDGGAAAATALTKVHQKRVHVASKGTVVGLSRRVKEAEAVAEAEKDRLRSERKAQSEIAQLAMTQAAAAPQAEKDTPGVSPGREIANTAGQSSAAEEGRQPTDMQALAAGPSQRHSTGDPHVAGSIEPASHRTISSAVVVSSHAPSAATAADATTANGSVAELRTAAAEEPWLPGLSDGRSGAYAIVVPARVPAAASTSPPSAGAPPPPPVKPSEAAGLPHAAVRRDEEFEHDQPLAPYGSRHALGTPSPAQLAAYHQYHSWAAAHSAMGISHAQHMSLPYGHPVAFPATVGIAQPYGLPLPGLYAHAYATAATLDPNAYAQWAIATQSWSGQPVLAMANWSAEPTATWAQPVLTKSDTAEATVTQRDGTSAAMMHKDSPPGVPKSAATQMHKDHQPPMVVGRRAPREESASSLVPEVQQLFDAWSQQQPAEAAD